jgi:predicted GNAT family acetyltransferase
MTMTDNSAASAVVENPVRHRYELAEGGEVAFAVTHKEPGRWIITYVEAPPALRGTGAAGRLMQGVLDLARAEGVSVTPQCAYARAWMQRRPEYGDLLG